jgi:3-hydroxyisobutyrate dehydrogenase-like beta-hydroxyacid dehydrogenase
MNVGIVGLGEAGAAMAQALRQSGHALSCLDIRANTGARAKAEAFGIGFADDPALFAAGADLVLVVVPARRALEVALSLVPSLQSGTVYADCTAKSISVRDAVANACRGRGIRFADVAIADTVSWPDRPVELLLSGEGTGRVAEGFAGTRFRTRVVDASRPVSAELKLLRSVYTKGLSAVLLETLAAAEKCGVRPEVQRSLTAFMETEFPRIAEMLVGSSIRHARRRADEMEDVGALVNAALGGAPMTAGATAVLRAIADAPLDANAATLDGVIRALVAADVFAGLAPPHA